MPKFIAEWIEYKRAEFYAYDREEASRVMVYPKIETQHSLGRIVQVDGYDDRVEDKILETEDAWLVPFTPGLGEGDV